MQTINIQIRQGTEPMRLQKPQKRAIPTRTCLPQASDAHLWPSGVQNCAGIMARIRVFEVPEPAPARGRPECEPRSVEWPAGLATKSGLVWHASTASNRPDRSGQKQQRTEMPWLKPGWTHTADPVGTVKSNISLWRIRWVKIEEPIRMVTRAKSTRVRE